MKEVLAITLDSLVVSAVKELNSKSIKQVDDLDDTLCELESEVDRLYEEHFKELEAVFLIEYNDLLNSLKESLCTLTVEFEDSGLYDIIATVCLSHYGDLIIDFKTPKNVVKQMDTYRSIRKNERKVAQIEKRMSKLNLKIKTTQDKAKKVKHEMVMDLFKLNVQAVLKEIKRMLTE